MRAARRTATALLLAALAAGSVPLAAQPQALVPPDNLVVEGVPAIPAALAQQVGRYAEFRSAGLQSWHPTRREMLVTTRFAETNQVHRVSQPIRACWASSRARWSRPMATGSWSILWAPAP